MHRGSVVRWVLGAAVVALLLPGAGMAQSDGDCACDSDGNGVVSVSEVIMGVNIALGKAAMGACMPADHQPDGQVMVDEFAQLDELLATLPGNARRGRRWRRCTSENAAHLSLAWQAWGGESRPTLESDSMILLFSHVRTGRWASVMPARLAETLGLTATIRAIPIREPEAVQTIGLVVPAREPMTPVTAALVTEARAVAATLRAA